MKKVILVLLVVILSAAGAVGAFWYLGVNQLKDSIENTLKSAQAQLQLNNSSITYASIDPAGFPMNLAVDIKGLNVVGTNASNELAVLFKGPVRAQTPIMGGNVSFILPTNIDIDIKTPQDVESYSVYYNAEPVISVDITDTDVFDIMSGNSPATPEELMLKFKSFSYTDKGSRILDKSTGEELYSQKQAQLIIEAAVNESRAAIRIIANSIESETNPNTPATGEIGKLVFSSGAELGKTSVKMDIKFDIPSQQMNIMTSEGFIEIQEFSLLNDLFGLTISGRIDKDGTDIAPYGRLNISMNNYNSLVDYYVTSLNKQKQSMSGVTGALSPGFSMNINEEEIKTSAKQMLRAISDDPTSSSSDLSITIKREKGTAPTDVTVGTLGVQQLMGLSSTLAAPSGTQQEQDNIGTSLQPQPQQPAFPAVNNDDPFGAPPQPNPSDSNPDFDMPEMPSMAPPSMPQADEEGLFLEMPMMDVPDMPAVPDMPTAPAAPPPPPPFP